jgi:hypothetical protein
MSDETWAIPGDLAIEEQGVARRDASAARGFAFWVVTILLALLLPAPVAIPVVVARFRRAPR